MDDKDLMELARRCVDEGFPVYELARALSNAKQEGIGKVMFGVCHCEFRTRQTLKLAEMYATRRPDE